MITLKRLKELVEPELVAELLAKADKAIKDMPLSEKSFQVSIQCADFSEVDAYFSFDEEFEEYKLEGFLLGWHK